MKKPVPGIRDLYPNATEEQLKDAEERLQAYARLLLQIAKRIASDPAQRAAFNTAVEKIRELEHKPRQLSLPLDN
ncbi:MAG: hypothetical protein Q8P35_01540 [Candidatus Yanofskybacteria bacterium]|nr:hypothetical protein [Candidatus Yanofskybacteria bacterium]